jgi:uncharacterized coiled-coil protein SlyX
MSPLPYAAGKTTLDKRVTDLERRVALLEEKIAALTAAQAR